MPQHHSRKERRQPEQLSDLRAPATHEARPLVAPLLFGLPFLASHGYQNRGDQLSIRASRVEPGRQVLGIQVFNEKGSQIELAGLRFTVATETRHQIVTTNEEGYASASDIRPHDRVTITLG